MTRSSFYLSIFVLFPIIFFLLKPTSVVDLSIWTALGRDSINQWQIIRQDFYTLTATKPMVYPFFLSVLYGILYKWGGLNLVIFVHAFVPSCWTLIWYKFAKNPKGKNGFDIWSWQTFLVFVTVFLGMTLVFTARPALVATIPALISYAMLFRSRKDLLTPAVILRLGLLEILWVNIHGSFLFLPLMLVWQSGLFVLRRQWNLFKNRIVTLSVLLFCTLISPFGLRVFSYTWETALVSRARGLGEWFPPHYFFYPFASWHFFIISACLAILLLRKIKNPHQWDEIAFDPFVISWLGGFFAIRNTYLMFLFLPLFIFGHFDLHLLAQPRKSSSFATRWVNVFIVGCLCLVIVGLSPFYKSSFANFLPTELSPAIDPSSHFEKMDDYLNHHSGNIFNDWTYGSDLALQQPNKYFVDTRNIIFTDQVDLEYEIFMSDPARGFSALEKYNFQFFLVDQKHLKTINWLKDSPRFHEVMREGSAVLFAASRSEL